MYEKKTLLEVSKSVRFKADTRPETRRLAMVFPRHENDSESTRNGGARHRRNKSMDLIKQLPSRNRDIPGDRVSTLHSKASTRRRKNSNKSSTDGIDQSNAEASLEDNIANRIYEALCNEIDDERDVVDAEQYGATILRDMKHSLTMKRKVKAKLNSYTGEKTRRIGLHKRIAYSLAMSWGSFKNSGREFAQRIELWHSHLHSIEGNFGSGVVTYFYFLRYLFYLNLLMVFLVGLFVFLPQQLYRHLQAHTPYPNVTFTGLELLTGTGWFGETGLYYGGYTNGTLELVKGYFYSIPQAYLFTTAAYFILTMIVISYSLAAAYRRNFVITSESVSRRSIPIKVFCGWDHQIASEDAAELKHKALFNEISVLVKSLNKDMTSNDCCVRFGHFVMRLGINVIILVMMIGTAVIVYFLLETKSLKTEIPVFGELVLALTITVVILLFPLISSTMGEWEEYESKQKALYLTLIRTFVMQIVVLGMLTYFWLRSAIEEWEFGCWESRLGQEMYRLVIMYLILILILTFLSDFVRKVLANIFPSIGLAEFNIATNTLNLIYIQTLCWLGTFFCPLLPIIVVLILFLMFYVKRYSTAWNCQPSTEPWKAYHANTVFLGLTLVSLLLTLIAISYTILMVHPSLKCGPFCHQKSMYSVVLYVLHKLFTIQVIGLLIKIFTFPAVVVGIMIIMCVFVYYLRAMASAHKEMTKMLRKQLILESKDKVFLLRWFETTMKNRPLSSESVQVHQVNETDPESTSLTAGLQGITSGIANIGSTVGSTVGNMAQKLKNVTNPIYRDKSRNDRELKSDPNDVPPIRTESNFENVSNEIDEIPKDFPQSPVVTPSPVQHMTGWDRIHQKMSPPGSMTPTQENLRQAFNQRKFSKK